MSFADAFNDDLRDIAARDGLPVDVAILDSGIDASHPLLIDRVVGSVAVVVDGNDVVVRATEPGANNDVFGHGTSVAGIVARIAPNARLFDVRVLGTTNRGRKAAILAGLDRAVGDGRPLINLSVACPESYAVPLNRICERAYARDQVIVAAMRNLPLVDQGLPAEFSSSIGVGPGAFLDPWELKYRTRNLIEFAAQGDQIVTAAAGGGYTRVTGSSFAAATVTGICALILGAYDHSTSFELKSLLKHYAEKLDG